MPRLAFSDWTALHLRFTAFVLPGAQLSAAADWWIRFAGADPEQITSNPRLGASQAVGKFGMGTLVVTTQPDRVDWFLGPSPIEAAVVQGPTTQETKPPSIGGAVESLDAFSDLSKQWLVGDIPNVNRLALGGVFSHQEENKQEAYLRLQDYVPVEVDPNSSDFLYQINLPTQSHSHIEGLAINRLSKWSVTMFKMISLRVVGEPFTNEIMTAIALRSEIDINTAQEYQGELPKERLADVMDELVQYGRELITNGVGSR
jgi:hypothetical protein